MILGIIGAIRGDIEAIITMLQESVDIQVVDTNELLRNLPHRVVNKIITNNQYKKSLLKLINEALGNVIITGNAMLNGEVCKWLNANGNKLCFMVRQDVSDLTLEDLDVFSNEYWDNPQIIEYELKNKYLTIKESLSKQTENTFVIDITDEDSQDLIRLAEDAIEGSIENTLTIPQIIKLITGDDEMTVEENIKKAMAELGIDVDFTTEEIKTEPKPKKVKVEKPKPIEPPKPVEKPIVKEETPVVEVKPPVVETKEPEPEIEVPDSIFVKLSDDSMAILIPEGIEFEDKELSGSKFKVATVKLPNWANKRLQELLVVTEKAKPTKKAEAPKPIEKPVETKPIEVVEKVEQPKEKPVIVDTTDLDMLVQQKADIDAKIKKARADGDEKLVNDLRKQRRTLRNKINSLK